MRRREWLKAAAVGPFLPAALNSLAGPAARADDSAPTEPLARVRPGDPDWPSDARWEELRRRVEGRLLKLESPLDVCRDEPDSDACRAFFKSIRNPFYLSENPALTQSSGWVGGWVSRPSAYAVAAEKTADVVAAVNFAREHRLRLVVKGGGHSYHGTSCAPDSLLVWTRKMNAIALSDAFVPQGCEATHAPQPAVSIESGAIWLEAYDAVTTRGGRYVQGGGCTTVGVAGLIQSGGFGSFSKRYGMAAAGLLEAEVVTADGVARVVNAATHPDLFWALKGGGGGNFGVVTRVTLRTRELPKYVGAVTAEIQATSDAAYRALVARVIDFYATRLFNPHWGEQLRFRRGNLLGVMMLFQGLSQREVEELWKPFRDWLAASPDDYKIVERFSVAALSARSFWNPGFFKAFSPKSIVTDDRPDAPPGNYVWAGDARQASQTHYGYRSAWLPAALLDESNRAKLVDALVASSRHLGTSLHFNKGLAGAPEEDIAAARDTATNPAVLDAFALAITGAGGPPSFPGIAGHEPDEQAARRAAELVSRSMDELTRLVDGVGSYVSESDFFERDWQRSYWGANHARLVEVKRRYDPAGLFFVHHGVGSERWNPDGFAPAS